MTIQSTFLHKWSSGGWASVALQFLCASLLECFQVDRLSRSTLTFSSLASILIALGAQSSERKSGFITMLLLRIMDAKIIWDPSSISFASILWLWPLASWSNCGALDLCTGMFSCRQTKTPFPTSWHAWRRQSFVKWVFPPGISNNIFISNLPQKSAVLQTEHFTKNVL